MALSVKVGTVTLATSTGNQSVSGVGFQPVAILFFGCAVNADDGGLAGQSFGFGAATSATARWATSAASEHNAATSDTYSRRMTTRCILFTNPINGATLHDADFVSMDADGFTINNTTAATAYRVGYLALGGAEITNVLAGNMTVTTGTGNEAYTGVGFQPDLLLLANTVPTSTTVNSTTDSCFSVGVAKASAAASFGLVGQDAEAAAITDGVLRPDRMLASLSPAAALISASLVSMDADGFTINRHESGSYLLFYLALKGTFQSKIGVDSQKTSTGTKATTGVGFTPKVIFLGSAARVADTAITAQVGASIGASDGTSEACASCDDLDAADPTQAGRSYSNAKIQRYTSTGAGASPTITTVAEADLTALGGDGFTLDWTAADATAREFFYLALGDAPAPAADFLPFAREPILLPSESPQEAPARDLSFLLQAPSWLPLRHGREVPAFLEERHLARLAESIAARDLSFIFPSFEGVAKYWTGLANAGGVIYRYRIALPNFQAATNPGVTDDETDNYAPGSIWVNKATDEAFICLSAVAGAAVWKSITDPDGGSP